MMKSRLRFLPEVKQQELAFVVRTIRAGFEHATARRSMPALRDAKLLKIILFGSYARGGWVEDPVGRYFSDYDLLCVVDREEVTDWAEYWDQTDHQLMLAQSAGVDLRTPHSLIVHSLDDVNDKLRLGRYFFMDIVRDGIPLFEEEGYPFAEALPLTPSQALNETRAYFEQWLESASRFFQNASDNIARSWNNEAAFLMHQAAERAYHCLLLVRTLYSPKTHRLTKLREMTEGIELRLRTVWPTETKFEKRCFSLLNDAYVKARYSPHYMITTDELSWLGERVRLLIDIVEQASRERLAVLEQAA